MAEKRHNRKHAQLLHRTYFLAMTKTELARRQSKQKRQPTTNGNRRPRTETEATKQSQSKPLPAETQAKNLVSPDEPETQTAEGRTDSGGTGGRFRTQHLRRMKTWEREYKKLCGAVADEREICCSRVVGRRESRCVNRAAHAACSSRGVRGTRRRGDAQRRQSSWQEQS
jgi:hypothetical protein